jgi:hypothetical protein
MRQLTLLVLFSLPASLVVHSQNPLELGVEYQRSMGKGYYDHLAGIRGESIQNKSSFSGGIFYQFSSNKSYSVSRGFGCYAGYRYSFGSNITGNNPFIGARIRFTFQNFEGKTILNSFLITPSAEAGYHFSFAKNFYAAPALGYGYTIKLTKEYNSLDEDEGGRFLPGISTGYRF